MSIAIYHVVYAHEGFEQAANVLHELVCRAIETSPGQRRRLFLDIEGHRNKAGGWDHDMFELQRDFLLGFLMPFLSEIKTPLYHAANPTAQRDDLPVELIIHPAAEAVAK